MSFRSLLPRGRRHLAALGVLMGTLAQAAPPAGGTLHWALRVDPPTLVPINTSAGGAVDVGPKMVEGLLTYDDALTPQPLLATAWDVSPDGLTYTFSLREGVQWHDGQPFTSADVAYSILALKQAHPRGRATFAQVREVQTPDAHTAILQLDQPAPYLITALAAYESPIVPRHLYEGRDLASNPANLQPVGTGPFVFKEWVRGSHIVLERNPNYWDAPRPYLDRVIARILPDAAARAAALESGDVQLAGQALAPGEIARFRELPQVRVDTRGWPYQGQHNQIVFNHSTPELQDVRVRQALAHAIDVQAINQLAWHGQGTPSATPIGVASRYHDASVPFYPTDPAQAERLLDEAGYPRGADGKRFALRLSINPYVERRVADVIRQSLQRIGVDAVLQIYDFGTYVKTIYADRAFDITVESQSNLFDPTVGVQRVYWSKNIQLGLPFSNGGHYADAEVDRLLEAAAVEPDEARRRDLFNQFQRRIHETVAGIDLGRPPETVVSHRTLQDAAPSAERTSSSFAGLHFVP